MIERKVTLFVVFSLIIAVIIFYFFNIGIKSSMVYDCSLVNQFIPEDTPCSVCPSGNVHINDNLSIENCDRYQRNLGFDEKIFSFFIDEYLTLLSRNQLEILYSDCAGIGYDCGPSNTCILGNEDVIHILHFRMCGCEMTHVFLLPKFPSYQSIESVLKPEYSSLIENNKLSIKLSCEEKIFNYVDSGCQKSEGRNIEIFTTDENLILKENHITCP